MRARFAVVLAAALRRSRVLPGTRSRASAAFPDANPLWVDFAGHDAPLPQKPGLTLAFTSGTDEPAAARANGAATVFFDLNFNNRVGTPTVPADPAEIVDRADRLFDFAVTVTGCTTPWIAQNELFGAQTPTPWTPTTAQYRANTLALLRRLAERGAKAVRHDREPAVHGRRGGAVVARPRVGRGPDPPGLLHRAERRRLHALGPVRASRAMRSGMRALVRRFTEIGIPASRVALELQFQSAPGTGGREGLQPRWKWLEIVKLQALAVRQVTKELRTTRSGRGAGRPSARRGSTRQGEAVCVYLWVRDPQLCERAQGGGRVVRCLASAVGQLDRCRPGVVCSLPEGRSARARSRRSRGRSVTATSRQRPARAARARSRRCQLDARAVLAAELAFVDDRFRRRLSAYLAALSRASS